eukprot:CAMPEP_0198508914 /NCGR_PEP_ID=MMETSP1462-20131121/13251_1 /TAXON_ID=1333877 /ORGANISM="Brandtodinium nutriculum, Strain RCC3387" /LENGTH=57 /DNA_ID=CAMNT_0044238207 /DNA_START=77 /DNA_END=250 /DNA_ORIENTATION=-
MAPLRPMRQVHLTESLAIEAVNWHHKGKLGHDIIFAELLGALTRAVWLPVDPCAKYI